jgi:hypothetical protein
MSDALYYGPEFISRVLIDWCEENGVRIQHIQSSKPNQNACIERFNRTYRNEKLNLYLFRSLREVREITYGSTQIGSIESDPFVQGRIDDVWHRRVGIRRDAADVDHCGSSDPEGNRNPKVPEDARYLSPTVAALPVPIPAPPGFSGPGISALTVDDTNEVQAWGHPLEVHREAREPTR